MNNDAELLRRYAEEGSEASFSELVNRRIGLVYSIACRVTRDPHRAKDATQQVFTSLARHAVQLARQPVLVGWFYRSAHRAAIDVIRADKRRTAHEQEIQSMHEILGPTGAEPDWQKAAPVLDRAISDLDATDRDAILLRYFDAVPYAEIGTRLHVTENAARMRVERALDKLHALLARQGITSSTAALSAALANQAAIAAPAGLASAISGAALMTSASTTAGIFMTTPTIIASLVATATLGLASFEFHAARTAEAAAQELSHQSVGLRRQVLSLEQRVEQSDRQLAQSQQQSAALQARLEDTATPKTTNPLRVGAATTATTAILTQKQLDEAAALERVTKEIKMRQALRDSASRPAVPIQSPIIGALYRQLEFTPDQIAQFNDLAKANAARHEELDKIAASQGMKISDPVMKDLYAQADAEFKNRVAATLGDNVANAALHFNETLPQRDMVTQIASALFYSEAPLTLPQANALVEILWRNMPRQANGASDANLVDTAAMKTQAQGVLSERQLPTLQLLLSNFEAANKRLGVN